MIVVAALLAAVAIAWLTVANPPVASAHTTGGINDCVGEGVECTTRGTSAPTGLSGSFGGDYTSGGGFHLDTKGTITHLRWWSPVGASGFRVLRAWFANSCKINGSVPTGLDGANFQITAQQSVTIDAADASGAWLEADIVDIVAEPNTAGGFTQCHFYLGAEYNNGEALHNFLSGSHDHDNLYVESGRYYKNCIGATARPASGSPCTDTFDSSNNAPLDLVFETWVNSTATPTPSVTPSITPTPSSTPTPTLTPTATPTPLPAPPSGGWWYIPDVAQAVRDLPGSLINAFATFTVPEPTMIASAMQTAEASVGVSVGDAQATALSGWDATVDIYDSKTVFLSEIGGIVGEVKNALVDSTCGSTPLVVTFPFFGQNYTLNFFNEEQLNVWWCPVVKPLIEAAMYVMFSVSALMLWMRFRRSGGNE